MMNDSRRHCNLFYHLIACNTEVNLSIGIPIELVDFNLMLSIFLLNFSGVSSSTEMGEIEGSYRVLQTPGTRLGAQFNAGISTLEPGQSLAGNMISGNRNFGKTLQIRVHGLDDSQEFFDIDVSFFQAFYF